MEGGGLQSKKCYFHDHTVEQSVLRSLLSQKQNDGIFCDVTMRVCGREIRAHSSVLASVSPYFASFFRSDLPRSYSQRSPQVIEIMVDDNGTEMSVDLGDAVSAVVDFVYSGTLHIDLSNVAHIAEIARVMQINPLIQFCEDFSANRLTENQTIHIYKGTDAAVETEAEWFTTTTSRMQSGNAPFVNERQVANTKPSHSIQQASVSTQVFPSLLYNSMNNIDSESLPAIGEPVHKFESSSEFHNAVPVAVVKRDGDEDEAQERNNHLETKVPFLTGRSTQVKGFPQATPSSCQFPSVRHSQRMRRKSIKLVESSERLKHGSVSSQKRHKMVDEQVRPARGRFSDDLDVHGEDGDGTTHASDPISSLTHGDIIPAANGLTIDTEGSPSVIKNGSVSLVPNSNAVADTSFMHKFSCSTCGFTTNNVRKMSAHTRDHKLANNECFYCERTFDSSERLTEHIDSEHPVAGTMPRPFSCAECGVWFRSHGQLAAHLPKHSAKRPFVCDSCGATFKWRNALRNHAITHSASKEHLCDVCGYATAHRAQLRAHRLVHTGDTLRCPWDGCEYRAIRLQNLKFHYLTHTQEKAHQCEFCGQSFSLQKNMRRHMLLHMDSAKKHECSRCDFTTLRYDKLKDHLHKQHNVGSAPERRLRITDLVNLSQSSMLPTQSTSDDLDPSDSCLTNAVIDVQPPQSSSSIEQVVFSDASSAPMQMVQIPDGMALLNGTAVSLMSSNDGGHAIAILLDNSIVIQSSSAEFGTGNPDLTPLQFVALGADEEERIVSGLMVGEGFNTVKDDSGQSQFVI